MRDLTLRQIEVIRAVMMTGTITGAAAFLNVSAPGISRLLKYTEESVGIRLFERKAGLFIPSVEASAVFDQVRLVHHSVENLNTAVSSLQKGVDVRLAFASAPSIAQFIAARVLRNVRRKFPDLFIDLNILKIEETMDYLLLERGEFVIMSSAVQSATVESIELARGGLVAIVPDDNPLAKAPFVSVHDLAAQPLIGVDPGDPYGETLARPFRAAGIEPKYAMRGRFAQTVVSLVRHGLGVAVIDEFSVAEVYMPGITRVKLSEPSAITAYVCKKKGRVLSGFADHTIAQFRTELTAAIQKRPWEAAKP
ncbi:MAG: LysR family transcriptional regulator [Paracoccaceae bacterium]|nr:LysR family transcriptional regulator [Paracoccaceae bacterium]